MYPRAGSLNSARMTPAIVERLPNGFTTAVCEVPGRHQVLITLFVRVGARFEAPAQSGLSHFVEHLLFRGSAAYPDAFRLNAAFEQVGSMPNAVTGVEATEIYMLAHPERVRAALATLADMVRHPCFADLEKERGIIHDEILYDYNDKGELINLGALAAQLLWPGHALGQPVAGTQESLHTFDDALARAHHAGHYAPQNMVLGLCGGIAAEQGLEMARACFGDWNGPGALAREAAPAPAAPSCPQLRKHLVHDSDNQFHVQLSFSAPGYNAPEVIPLMLLTRMLDDGPNTRLQQHIREELALAYHVGAEYTGFWDAGQLDISTSVMADRLEPLLDALADCLLRFRDDGLTGQELEAARHRHRLDLEFSRDSLDARVERHVWPLLYSTPMAIEEELERMEQITPEHVHRLAREVLGGPSLRLVLVGPVDDRARELTERLVGRF